MKALRWVVKSAGMVPGDVWAAFVTILCLLVMHYAYDGLVLFW